MGGDRSQKLLPWRGLQSSPGRSKPPAHSKITNVTEERPMGFSQAALLPSLLFTKQVCPSCNSGLKRALSECKLSRWPC